jgi:hypothetical protein
MPRRLKVIESEGCPGSPELAGHFGALFAAGSNLQKDQPMPSINASIDSTFS